MFPTWHHLLMSSTAPGALVPNEVSAFSGVAVFKPRPNSVFPSAFSGIGVFKPRPNSVFPSAFSGIGVFKVLPYVEGPAVLDVSRQPSEYTFSNGNSTAVNNSTVVSRLNWWAISDRHFPRDGSIRYWEVAVGAGQAQYNGYMGVASIDIRDKGNGGAAPVDLNGIGYRGNGTIWESTTQRVTGLPVWGAGAVLMFAFRATTAELWVGLNGVWSHDPATAAATFKDTTPAHWYFPFIQGRDVNEGGTLRDAAADFTYAVPANATPLGV